VNMAVGFWSCTDRGPWRMVLVLVNGGSTEGRTLLESYWWKFSRWLACTKERLLGLLPAVWVSGWASGGWFLLGTMRVQLDKREGHMCYWLSLPVGRGHRSAGIWPVACLRTHTVSQVQCGNKHRAGLAYLGCSGPALLAYVLSVLPSTCSRGSWRRCGHPVGCHMQDEGC
jgi:hypothetical protein